MARATASPNMGPAPRGSDRVEPAGRVAEAVEAGDAEAVGHAEEDVGHRDGAGLGVAAGVEGPAAVAGEDEGQVVVVVAVAVAVAAAVDDHRVVEQGVAVDVLRLVELLE